jgi:CheY-like chemotaxis protein
VDGEGEMALHTARFKPAILLVDADEDTRELHRMLLDELACWIEEACDGVEAYGRALSHPPDVVVTEMRLPRMDGRTLIERLRTDPRLHTCSILVVAGSADGMARNDLLRIGADEMLTKPCEPEVLVRAVERLSWRVARQSDGAAGARSEVAAAADAGERFGDRRHRA